MKKRTRRMLGLLMVFTGIFIGFYVGCYLMLYGGLISIISGIKAGWVAPTIALGVIKVLGANFVGWLSGIIIALPGLSMIRE